VSVSLEFDGRIYCRLHPDVVSLARVVGVDGLVCVVCQVLRAVRLHQALAEIQWQGCREDGEPSCPVCSGQPRNGHLANCVIGAALRETETGP
jgi:hypothetical protein